MPEGDTVHGIAAGIRERIAGQTLRRVGGTSTAARIHAYRLVGARVEAVEAVGKHLLIDFEGGWTLHVHLGMTGRWRFGPPTGRRGDGRCRVALETAGWSLRCYDAPSVELDRSPRIWRSISRLGPDLAVSDPDLGEAVSRARAGEPRNTISQIMLDQSVAAGIGNVYRNEVLFETGIHPATPVGSLDDDQLLATFGRAARQLRLNSGRRRSTTGARGHRMRLYVYEREDRPCRRCGTRIRRDRIAGRTTFWCPSCQRESPRRGDSGSG